jgi:prevent-host-death family protein
MATFNMHRAKTELSDLVARAEAGEEIVIARRNKPAVKLVPVDAAPAKRRVPGAWKGRFTIPDDIFEPLSADELRDWEDGPVFPAAKR